MIVWLLGSVALAVPLGCEQARGVAERAAAERADEASELRLAADELCGITTQPEREPDRAPVWEEAAPEGRVAIAVFHSASVPGGGGECADLAELLALGGDARPFANVLARCDRSTSGGRMANLPSSGAGRTPAMGAVAWSFASAKLTSGYGWRLHPILKKRRFHHGLDLAASMGEPIPAIASGKVVWAGDRGDGYGEIVEILHPSGAITRYGHNSVLLVHAGEPVVAGQAIARAGSTGLSTAPHVHFEVRVNGEAVDPRPYIKEPRRLE